ncbi:MAG: class I SAM-dependent methyltransferase [Bdellovibrionales bacterium]|nr:class I SAM-dependent methyltransferase [Bdellovibrionales bacterium]
MSAIANRLKKNLGKLQPWAEKFGIEAFRLYDRDIPEYPFMIEVYGKQAVLWDRRDDEIDRGKEPLFEETVQALCELLGCSREAVIVKRRARQQPRGSENTPEQSGATSETQVKQYQKLSRRSEEVPVREGDMKFLVNLHDYLDTGLFLDHRLTRKLAFDLIQKRTKERLRTRFLNLFCYTGSFSVYAAKAGATVTSVDLSPNYLAWAERNFIANGLMTANHRFINDDVLAWLKDGFAKRTGPYEFIFCDPPTFSNSKKMEGTWEVNRDHRWLIERCLEALTPEGTLIFSANRRDFVLDDSLRGEHKDPAGTLWRSHEITRETLPKDFHDLKARKVYRFQAVASAQSNVDRSSPENR